jgi:hypothetical protein
MGEASRKIGGSQKILLLACADLTLMYTKKYLQPDTPENIVEERKHIMNISKTSIDIEIPFTKNPER